MLLGPKICYFGCMNEQLTFARYFCVFVKHSCIPRAPYLLGANYTWYHLHVNEYDNYSFTD